MARRTERYKKVEKLREAVLALLRAEGRWRAFDDYGCRVQEYEGHGYSVFYHTPFNPPSIPERLESGTEQREVRQLRREYRIEMWGPPGKVLNIYWEAEGDIKVTSMRRGPWEEEFLAIASGVLAP